MSLAEYVNYENDYFKHDEDVSELGFPCCACTHRRSDEEEEPCKLCCYNANSENKG